LGREHEEVSAEWRLGVTSLQDALVGDVRPTLVLFLVAVTILLTIACANVANLFLVRGVRRERQFAVRTALGARRRDLAADVLLESVVLSTAGGIGGLILGWSVLRFFLLAAPPGIPRLDEVGLDPRALGFAIGLSLLTALLFGAIPAWRAESGNLSEGLRSGRSTVGGGHKRIQQAIVVAELALSLALLATAGLVLRTFSGYTRWDPGYRTDGVLVFSAQFGRTKYRNSAELQAGFDQMEAALRSLPGVAAEGMASGWPLVGGIEPRPFVPEGSVGEPGTEPASANYFEVSPGYLEALGIALLEGRTLQSSDRAGSLPVVVVNRTLTQMAWRDESPVGKRIFFPDYDETAVVVGVVADVPPLVPGDPTPAQVYWSNRQHTRPVPYFVVTADGDATLLARAARARLLEVDPDLSVSTVRSLEDVVAGNLVQPRFTLYLVAAFAVAALILAVLGIYAVIAFAVAQRSREFGIRLALGSTSRELLRSVLFDAGRLAVLGALVGLVGTLSVAKLLGRVVHGVAPNDPLTIGTAAAALLLAATLACMVPAIRAGRVNVRSILADS
jgi:predicted permease